MSTIFCWLYLSEIDHMEDIGVDGKIRLICIFNESGCGGIDCIDLAQYRDSWRALVNKPMNIRVL